MKRFVPAFVILAALALAMPAHAEKIKIRLAHGASHTHPFNTLAQMWKQAVERRTDKVDIKIFGDRQLGGDKQVLEGAIAGTIDAAFPSSVLFSLVLKDQKAFDALQLPFVVNSYENLATMLTPKPAMQMLAGLKRDGLVGLSFGEAGLRHFLSRKGPVQRLQDFKGLKKMQALMKPIVREWEKKDPLIAAYVAAAKKLSKGN